MRCIKYSIAFLYLFFFIFLFFNSNIEVFAAITCDADCTPIYDNFVVVGCDCPPAPPPTGGGGDDCNGGASKITCTDGSVKCSEDCGSTTTTPPPTPCSDCGGYEPNCYSSCGSSSINSGSCGTCISKPNPNDNECEVNKGESCQNAKAGCGDCLVPPPPMRRTCGVNGHSGCEPQYGESCSTCPSDCGGSCLTSGNPYCGDASCNGNEYYPPSTGSTNCYDCFNPSISIIENPEVEVILNIDNNIWNNPFWKNTYTQYVPPDKIYQIPPDKIDVTKVVDADLNKITKVQLLANDNFNKVIRTDLLNIGVVNEVIRQITGLYLDIFLNPGSRITNISKQINVSKASLLKVKCDNPSNFIEINDIKQESFKELNGAIEIKATEQVTNLINDCFNNEFLFSSKDGRIIMTKDSYDPTYTLEKAEIKLNYETLATNTTSSVTIDSSVGFVCMTLGKGTELSDSRNNYKAIEPYDGGSDHKLCLKKKIEQRHLNVLRDDCYNCSMLDLLNYKDSLIKGRLIYKKLTEGYWLKVA